MNIVPATVRRALRSLRVRAAATVGGSGGGTRHGTALATLVAAVVLGILGMHALASHGTPATSDAPPGTTSMAGMAADVSHQAGHSSRHASEGNDVGTHNGQVSSRSSGEGSGHGDAMSMLMLCVVVLTAAALTLLVLLIVGIAPPLLPASFHPAALRARAMQTARGTGPPPEWQYSVIRC